MNRLALGLLGGLCAAACSGGSGGAEARLMLSGPIPDWAIGKRFAIALASGACNSANIGTFNADNNSSYTEFTVDSASQTGSHETVLVVAGGAVVCGYAWEVG